MKTVDLSTANNNKSVIIDIEYSIACVKAEGGGIIKLFHPQPTRTKVVRTHLRSGIKRGTVKQMIEGEKFNAEDRISRYFCNVHPELLSDADYNASNSSVTLILV